MILEKLKAYFSIREIEKYAFNFEKMASYNPLVIQEQDEKVIELAKAVDRLSHVSRHINNELKEQNGMIGDLENDIDGNTNAIETVNGRLDRLKRTLSKNCCSDYYIVIVLVCILLVMILLAIYV